MHSTKHKSTTTHHHEAHTQPFHSPAPLAGEYACIYADPPWRYRNSSPSYGRAIERHYPTMVLEEICALDVPKAKDAVLFLWATNPLLPEALSVMSSWGFKYKTNACWVKDKQGMGYYVRGQHEFLLIGTRGRIGCPAPETRPSSVIVADRRKHSQKPPVVYDLIEQMYPTASKIELFARNSRDGWDCWGNQAPDN